MTNKIRDMICSVIMLVFGAGMLILARDIPHKIQSDVGSAYVPTVIAICIIVVAVAKLVLSMTKKDQFANKKIVIDQDWGGGDSGPSFLCSSICLSLNRWVLFSRARSIFSCR